MSLINDVLNDLDKSKSEGTCKKGKVYSSPFLKQTEYVSKNLKMIMVSFLFINMLCILGGSLYKNYHKKHDLNMTGNIELNSSKTPVVKEHNGGSDKNLYEVASLIPSIVYGDFDLKPKFKRTSLQPNQSQQLISMNKDAQSHATQKPSVSVKGNKKGTFFIKKYSPISKREQSEADYKKVLLDLESHQIDKAQAQLISIVAKDPSYVPARLSLNQLVLSKGDFDKALVLADQNLVDFPGELSFMEMKANVLLQANQPLKALQLLRNSLPELSEETADYYNLMAVAYEKIDQLAQAGGIYQQLVKIRPDKGAYWLGLALALENASQVNQAQGAYTRAMEAYDNSPVIAAYAKNRLNMLRG